MLQVYYQGIGSGSFSLCRLSILQTGLKEKTCWKKKWKPNKSLWLFLSLTNKQIIACKMFHLASHPKVINTGCTMSQISVAMPCVLSLEGAVTISIFKTLFLLVHVCAALRIGFTEVCKIGQTNCTLKVPIPLH